MQPAFAMGLGAFIDRLLSHQPATLAARSGEAFPPTCGNRMERQLSGIPSRATAIVVLLALPMFRPWRKEKGRFQRM
jgi:hypothetical protein